MLFAIPFAGLAFVVGVLLDGPSGHSNGFDRVAYPVLALGMFACEVVLALRRRATSDVVLAIVCSACAFFLAKLVFILFLAPPSIHTQIEMTETFFWVPAVYVLCLLVPGVRGGRVVPFVFFGAMGAVSFAYLVSTAARPEVGVAFALVELNLANLTLLSVTHSFLGSKERLARAEAKADAMQRLAHTDLLTDLPNRLQLQADLERALSRAASRGRPLALVFLDLDGFKAVNDTLGHEAGDGVLREAARRWRTFCREGDLMARLGGDEFVVVLRDASDDEALAVAGRLVAALAPAFQLGGQAVQVSASAGVSVYPDDADDGATLLRHADSALYQVKRSGKNGVKRFQAELDIVVEERSTLQRELRSALARGELTLAYQPIVDLNSGEAVKLEALLRWQHPQRGAVPPADFIAAAEESGLILPIGTWVLREACEQARLWHERSGRKLKVAVNVAPLQLAQPDFSRLVAEALASSGLAARYLELELTEGAVLNDVEGAGRTLRSLRQLGVSVAIDDFGTGYSSLSYLRDLPIDTIKIDRSFVRDLATPRLAPHYALALIEAILSVARTLDLEVVAEGIETEAQVEILRGLGCHAGQGYYSRGRAGAPPGDLIDPTPGC
jgi:diguanylate cyclase (GGDEF)-like protein